MGDFNKKVSSSDFVSWDINTTGRRLIDEICQIAAHSPDNSYNQYVMPHRDIDYSARKRYLLKTVNIGVYRALRETIEGKVLKTKSEISALTEFLVWLETTRVSAENKELILMYYENFTPAPFILIESLKKFKLLPRFKESVAGFANCFDFIKAKCEKSMQTYSIKTLAKVLLNKDNDKAHDASERAKVLYDIVAHLCVGESQDGHEDLATGLQDHILTVDQVETRIAKMKVILNKQNSLKPIFGPFIRNDKKRRQALVLRRHLTNADIEYEALKGIWSGNEDMKSFLKDNLKSEVKEQDIIELETMITKHFNISSGQNAFSNKGNNTTGTDKIINKRHSKQPWWYGNKHRNNRRRRESNRSNDNSETVNEPALNPVLDGDSSTTQTHSEAINSSNNTIKEDNVRP